MGRASDMGNWLGFRSGVYGYDSDHYTPSIHYGLFANKGIYEY